MRRIDVEPNPLIEDAMRRYEEHRAAMRLAIERKSEEDEIAHYQAAVRALKEARKLAGIEP